MAKAPRKVYDLAEIMRQEYETAPEIQIPEPDQTFTIPAATFWPDSVYDDDRAGAKALLGDQYAAWSAGTVDLGGGVTIPRNAAAFWRAVAARLGGATIPESGASTDS